MTCQAVVRYSVVPLSGMRKTSLVDSLHIDKLLLDLQVEVRSLVKTKPA